MAAPLDATKSPSRPLSHRLDPTSIHQVVSDLIGDDLRPRAERCHRPGVNSKAVAESGTWTDALHSRQTRRSRRDSPEGRSARAGTTAVLSGHSRLGLPANSSICPAPHALPSPPSGVPPLRSTRRGAEGLRIGVSSEVFLPPGTRLGAFALDGETLLLPMELVEGHNLRQRASTPSGGARRLCPEEAVPILVGICEGVAAVHARGPVGASRRAATRAFPASSSTSRDRAAGEPSMTRPSSTAVALSAALVVRRRWPRTDRSRS